MVEGWHKRQNLQILDAQRLASLLKLWPNRVAHNSVWPLFEGVRGIRP